MTKGRKASTTSSPSSFLQLSFLSPWALQDATSTPRMRLRRGDEERQEVKSEQMKNDEFTTIKISLVDLALLLFLTVSASPPSAPAVDLSTPLTPVESSAACAGETPSASGEATRASRAARPDIVCGESQRSDAGGKKKCLFSTSTRRLWGTWKRKNSFPGKILEPRRAGYKLTRHRLLAYIFTRVESEKTHKTTTRIFCFLEKSKDE